MLYKGQKVSIPTNDLVPPKQARQDSSFHSIPHWLGLIFKSPVSPPDYKRLETPASECAEYSVNKFASLVRAVLITGPGE